MADNFLNSANGKVALITGASDGLGAATAREFAKQGARLALHGRNVERLTKVQQQCVELGLRTEDVVMVVGELSNVEEVNKIAADTLKHFGTLDILINNAGCGLEGDLDTITFDMMDQMFHLNVKVPLRLVQLFKKDIIKNKGCIINVSSIFGLAGVPPYMAYSIAKAAMLQLTANLNIVLGPKGVRCNSICPGVLDNKFGLKVENRTEDEVKQLLDGLAKMSIANRLGKNEEIAQSILFLCCAPYVMGQTLVVDGGILDARLLNCAHLLEARNKEN